MRLIKLKKQLGIMLFWLGWPVFKLILPLTKRTRCIIMHDNQIVVVQPWLSNGKWGLPGGGIKRGEDPLDAVIREVREETSIKLAKKDCKLVNTQKYSSSGLSFSYKLYVIKLDDKPKLRRQKGEIIDIAWVNIDKINPSNSSSDALRAVELI